MHRDASEDSTTTATSIQFSVDSSFVGGDGGDGAGRSRRSSAGNKSSANRKTVLAKGAPWASAYSFHTVSPPATQGVKSKLASGSTAPTAAAAPPKSSSQHPPLFPQQPSPPAAPRGALVTSPASASSSVSFVEAPVVLHPSRSVSPSDASLLFVQAVAKLDSPLEASLTKPKQQQRQQEHDMSSDQESESRNADRDSYHPRLMPQGSTSKSGGGNMKSVSANLASHSITSSRDSIDFQVDDNDGDDAPPPPPIAPPAVSATAAREGDGERGGTSLPSKPLAQQPALSAVKTATPPATLTVGGKTLVLKTATAHGGAGAKVSAAANAPPPCVVSPEQLTPMKTVTAASGGGAAGPALMAPSSPPSRSPPPGHGGASSSMGSNDGQQQQQLLQRLVVTPIHATSQPSGAAVSTTSTQNRAGSLASPRHDVLSAHGPRGPGRSVLAAAAGEGTTALEPHLPSPLQPSRPHGEEDDDDARMHTLHQRTQSLSSPASTHISNIASGVHFNRAASFSHTSLPEPNHSNSGGGSQQRRASSVSVQPEDDPVYCTVSEMTNAASMRGGTLSMHPIGMATAASGGANNNSVASPRRPTLAPSATSAARHVQSFDMSLDESNAQLTMGTPRELSGRHGTGGSWRVKGSSAASQPNLAGDAAATASNSTPSPTTLSPSPTYSNVRHVMPLPTFSRPDTAGKGDGDGKQLTASTKSAPSAVAATAAPRTSSRGHAASLASGAGVNPNSRSGRTSQSGEGSGRPSAACGVEDQESQKQQQQQQQPRRRSGVSAVLNALGGKLLQRRRESGSTASKSGTDDDDGNNDADGSATSLRSRHSTSRSFISGLSRVSSRLKRGARKAIAAGRTSGKAASSKQTSDLRNNSGVQQAAAAAATTEQGTDAATEVQTVADTATNTTVTMAPADQPTRFDSAARGRGGRGPGGGDGDGGGGGGAVVSLMAPHALSPAQLQLVRPTPTRDNQSLSVDGSIDFYTDVEETREAEMLASHEGPRGPPRPIANASDTAPHSGTVPSQPRLPMQEAEEYRDNGSSSARGGEEREHEAGEEEEVEDGTAAQPRNDGATQRKKRKEEKSQSRHRHRSHRKHHHHRSRTSTMSDNNNSNREDAVLADESSSSTSSSSPASSASITSSVLRRHKERERRRRRQHRSEKRRRKETANQKSTADAERSADKRLNESQQARQREMESRSAATRPRQRRVMSANASAVATSDEEQRRRSSSWHRTRHGARARHNAKKDKAGVMLMGKQLYHSKLGEEAVHLYAAAEEYVRRRLRRSCERQDERSGVANGADAHERGRTAASAAQAGSNHRLRRQRQGKQGREAGDAGNAPEQSLAEALAARRRAILAESRVHSSVNHFRAAWHNHTMDRQRRWLQQYDAYKDWRRRLQQREKERKLRSQEAAIAAAVATAASRSASRSRAMLDEVSCSKNANSRNPKSPSARPAAREASLKNGVSLTGRAASVRRQQRLDAYEAALTSEIALLDEAIEKMRRHALWAEASPAAAAIVAESNTHKEPQDAGAPAMSADEHVATPLPHRQPTSACSKPQGGAPKAEKPVTLRRSDQSRNDANAEQRGSKQQRKTQYSSLTEAADAVRCAPPSAVVACRTPARATVELQRRYEELLDEMVAHMEGGEARVGNNRSNSATSLAGRRRSSAQGSQKSPVHVPSKRFTPWRSADEEGKAGARQCAEALRAEYYRLSRFSSTPPADMQRQRPPQPLPTASEEDNTSSPMKREEEEEEVLARIETSYAQALRPSCAVCRPQRFDEYVTLGLLSMLHSTSEPSTDVVRNAADANGTGAGARPAKHPSSPRTLLQRRIREDLYAPPKRSSKPHVAGAAAVTGGVMVEAPQLAPPPQPPPPPEPHPFTPSLSLVLDSLRARLMKDEHRARATLIAAEEAAAEALRRQYIIATICTLRALRAKEEAEEAAKEKARETLQLQLQQQQQQQLLLQQALSSHSYGSSRRLFEEEQEEEEDQQHVTHEPVAPAIATASEPSFANALLVGRSDNLRGDDSSNSSSHRRSDNEEEEDDDDDDLRGRCHADRLGDRDAQSRCSGSSGSCGSRPHTCSWRGTTPPPLHAERLDDGNRREHLPSVESDDHHHHNNNNGSAGVVRRALQRDVALLQNVSASRVTEPSHSPLSSTRAGADYTRMSSGSSGNVRGHGPFSSTQPGSPASEEPMHELETRNAASAAGENSTPSTAFSQSSRGEAAQSSTSDDDHDGENQRRHSEDASTPLFELHDDKDREESDSKKDSSQASSTTHDTPSAESLPLPAAPPAALHVEKGTAVAETAKEAKDASCSQREDGKELSNAVRRTPEGPAHAGNAERHGDDDASSASLEFQTNEDEASKADSAAASDESPTSNSGSNNKSRRSSILLTQTDTSMTPVVAAPSTSNQETSHISEPLTSVEKATTTDDKVSGKGSKDACVRPLSIDRNDHLASSCPSSDASLEDASDAQSDSQDTTKKDTAAPDLVKAERRETQKPTETAPAGAREQEKQPEAEAAQPPTADKANTENGKIAEKEEKDDDDDNDDDEEFVVHVGAATAQEKAREEEKAEIGVTPQQHDKGSVSGGEGAKSEPVVLAEVTPSDNEADMNAEGAADAAAHPAAGDAVVEGDSEVAPDKEAAPPSIEREDDEADGAEERKATTAAAAASAVAIVNAGDAGREVDASPPPHDTIIAESRADTPANSATDRALLDAASQTPPLLLSCLVQRQPSSPRRRVRFSLPPEHAQESGGSSDEEAGGAAAAGRDDEDKRSEHADVCERAEISSSTDAATPEKPHDSPRAATHERDDDAPHIEEGDEAEEEGEDGVNERTATDLLEKLNELDALLLYEFPSYFTTGTDRDGFPAAVMRPLRDTYTPRRASLLPAAAAAAAAAAPTATSLPGVVRRTSFFTPAPPAVLPSLLPSVMGVSPTKPSETLLEVEEPQGAVHKGDTVPPRVEAGDAAREKKVSDVPAYQPTPLAPPQLPAESLASQLRRKYGLRPPPSLSFSRPTTAAPAFPAADRLSRRSSREVPTLPSSLSSTHAATTSSAAVAASSPVAVPASGAADLRATTRTPPAAGSKSTAVASRTPAQPAAKPRPTTTDTSIEAVQEPATAQASQSKREKSSADFSRRAAEEAPLLSAHQSRLPTPNDLTAAQKTALLLSDRSLSLASSATTTQTSDAAATAAPLEQARLDGEELQQLSQQPSHTMQFSKLSAPVKVTAATVRHTVPSSLVGQGGEASSFTATSSFDSSPLSVSAAEEAQEAVPRSGIEVPPLARPKRASHWF